MMDQIVAAFSTIALVIHAGSRIPLWRISHHKPNATRTPAFVAALVRRSNDSAAHPKLVETKIVLPYRKAIYKNRASGGY
jgi:hypothetical protein